ncbi:BREX-3 system P-loop-containing protein BrxF, partial [Pseudomonadota bacterium]
FDRSLSLDPIRLLKNCSRKKTLVVCWPGEKSKSGLSYAKASHPEYRTYKANDLTDIIFTIKRVEGSK